MPNQKPNKPNKEPVMSAAQSNEDMDEISLCFNCQCMTKTVHGLCGKCEAPKSNETPEANMKLREELRAIFLLGPYGELGHLDDKEIDQIIEIIERVGLGEKGET